MHCTHLKVPEHFEAQRLDDLSLLAQIAQQIIGALPTDLDSPEREAIFDAFLGVFEAALFRSDTMENTKTVKPSLFDNVDSSSSC